MPPGLRPGAAPDRPHRAWRRPPASSRAAGRDARPARHCNRNGSPRKRSSAEGRSAFSITRSFVESRRPRFVIGAVRGPRRPPRLRRCRGRLGAAAKPSFSRSRRRASARRPRPHVPRRGAAAARRGANEPTGATGEAPPTVPKPSTKQTYELGRGDGAAAAAAAARALPDAAGTSTSTCGQHRSRQERLLHQFSVGY